MTTQHTGVQRPPPAPGAGRPRDGWRPPPAGHGWARRLGRAGSATLALVVLGFSVAACGGSPKSPGVAGLGRTPSTTSPAGGPPPTIDQSNFMAKLLAYTQCMRAHGIHDFPDPTAGPNGQGGGFSISAGAGSDLNPNNAAYEAANRVCQAVLPYGGAPPPVTAKQLAAETKYAECVRQHGFPDFPDPNSQGTFVLHNFDLSSPQFHSTTMTCRAVAHFTGPMSVNASNSGPSGPASH